MSNASVTPALVAGIYAFLAELPQQGLDGRDLRAVTPVFDGLCPAMTSEIDVAGLCT